MFIWLRIMFNRLLFWGIGRNDFMKVLGNAHPFEEAQSRIIFHSLIAPMSASERRTFMRALKRRDSGISADELFIAANLKDNFGVPFRI